jgi:hypothetical protein
VIKRGLLILAVALCVVAGPAIAERERIRDYRSEITVHADGSVTVVETITVVADGKKIKRGIYRDFPTDYEDTHGKRVRVGFKVVEVLRDGAPEPYFTERKGNGVRVYMGSRDVILTPDHYTYTLAYRTDRQIGFFDDFDELYFNAIGHGWEFAIERAQAVVHLPVGADVLSTIAYTGRQGTTGRDYTTSPGANGGTKFSVTRELKAREGLTIVIAWPKGYVAAPTASDKAGFLLRDNTGLLVGLIGLIAVAAYYLFAWNKGGRDPGAGTIVPLFEPPEGLSPAAMRFIIGMGYDKKAFTAAVVNMAVKGYLTIDEDEGEFTLGRNHRDKAGLSPGERKIADKLFTTATTIKLHHTNHKRIQGAIKAFKDYLRAEFAKAHFRLNRGYFIPGAAVSVAALVAVALGSPDPHGAIFMTVWLSAWTGGCAFLVVSATLSWRRGEFVRGAGLTLFSIPFIGGEFVGLGLFMEAASLESGVLLVLIVLVNALFYYLLKAPTFTGRQMMDQIEGFKLYLGVAEKDRLEAFHPPETTPELFEKYLPFALALDVENQWGERFESVLAQAGDDRQYRPGWYSGHRWNRHGIGDLGSNLGGSFSNAIASSARAPGSSSGGGGGGFSGGGGGGGGGGGW